MRYDKRVQFFDPGKEQYNPDTGEMERTRQNKVSKLCSVNDLTAQRQTELFGRLDVRALSIHHQGKPINALMVSVDGVDYHITTSRALRTKATYIVTEQKV